MVQRGSDPVSGPSNEFYSNFPFTAHQSRIVPQACCVNPLATTQLLTYFLLCRASELFAYANGLVHPDYFCLTRDCLTFFRGDLQVNIEDRARADSVKVLFVASKTDQNREGRTTTRVRMAEGAGVDKTPVGAFEALVELLDAHP